jgi:hypothetical protein
MGGTNGVRQIDRGETCVYVEDEVILERVLQSATHKESSSSNEKGSLLRALCSALCARTLNADRFSIPCSLFPVPCLQGSLLNSTGENPIVFALLSTRRNSGFFTPLM